jgi:uncharacterized protein (TIGR03083 family)
MSDIWTGISAERGALADDLANLTPAQWDTPSLCSEWTVRDIVAHVSATASLNPAPFFFNMAWRADPAKSLHRDVIDTRLWRSWRAGCFSGRRTISGR